VTIPDGTPCDDGDACTFADACGAGVCAPASVVGCDDGDPCTVDLCDPAGGACFHDAVFCDDGDPCTADLCDPANGSCGSVPLDPADASDLRFLTRYLLVWTGAPGPDHWNTYRGTIPSELLGSRRAAYDHACFESSDLAGNGPTASIDFLDPAIATAFYYVVGGETACGDDAPGTGVAGQPRPVPFPCVTPP
jgi:hypothetical protein